MLAGDEHLAVMLLEVLAVERDVLDEQAELWLAEVLHPRAVLDLAALPELELPRFDLVLALCTLQSPGVDDRVVLQHIVQSRLAERGSVILAIPNCRYRAGEVLHGARMKNFRQPDLSLCIKHIAYFKKYLQQHKRQVFVTGRNYIFVTGVYGAAG